MIFTDRSRIVARMECPRMGYWNYAAGGKGWQKDATALPLAMGIAVHEALAKLLINPTPSSIVQVAEAAVEDYRTLLFTGRDPKDPTVAFIAEEQSRLIYGMVYTWASHRLPKLREEFTLATFPLDGQPWVEKEFSVELSPGVTAMLRLDAVLRRPTTGELVILDFKTLSYPSEEWYKQWEHNAQTYLYLHAVETFTGEPVEGMMYEGLVKGTRRTETGHVPWKGMKVQASPYCYGYSGPDGVQLEYTSRKGYRKVGSWQDHTPAEWFMEVLRPAHEATQLFDQLFCIVPPLKPMQWEIDRWLKQTVWAEALTAQYLAEIAQAGSEEEAAELVDTFFPTNEARCFKYGPDNQCVYTPLCFTREPVPEELGFIPRVPHHTTEEV